VIDALAARSGIVCLVGAGGKKSALYHLAALHSGRVGITATVHIPFFPPELQAVEVIGDDATDLVVEVAAAEGQRVAFAMEPGKRGRWGGVAAELIPVIHRRAGFDVTLVKADGARGLLIKAPGVGEPRIPAGADTVLPVVSAAVLGHALDERTVHRPECLRAVTGLEPGAIVRPAHLARLLTSPAGGLKAVGEATVIPLINMVDDAVTERWAREAAEQALALSDRLERVVLACMKRTPALVAVIER
jgi:probable selenium-dependent hydroxylase accessory protein YqeC